MCPHATNGDATNGHVDRSEMVGIENTRVGRPTTAVNGVNGVNGINGHAKPEPHRPAQRINPYAPRASEFLNNVANFKIIESTLRGESDRNSLSLDAHADHVDLTAHSRGRTVRKRIL